MWELMGEQERRRHPQKALSARTVQTARAGDHARRIADGGGLYLFVAPGGAKSWVLRTVVKGKRCDLGLGSVTLVSLAEAREEARRLRRIARTGGDPLAERRHGLRPVPSFAEAARQVHASHAATFKNEKPCNGINSTIIAQTPHCCKNRPPIYRPFDRHIGSAPGADDEL